LGSRRQHTAQYQRFCRLLRRWRVDAGLTQRQLAEQVGRPPSWVHKSETGERRMDPLELVLWARATGVAPTTCMRAVQRLL